jgi:branched-chain amino acid aminotransferase
MAQVWCNGAFLEEGDAKLSISDRGFTLADGIFETLLAVGHTPLWLPDHLRRMRSSADFLGLHVAHDDSGIAEAVTELLRRHAFVQSAVRITLTRGPTSKRGLWVSDNPDHPTLLITCAPAAKPAPQRVVICRTTRRNERSPLSQIKSLNYGDNILARREAIAKSAGDALILNGQGHIACATVGNVFFLVGGVWLTPKLSDGILPGLARQRLIGALGAQEQSLTESMIAGAEVAFISNSLGCTPITHIEDRELLRCPDENTLNIYT